ncbi:MAG: Maf family protein [Rhizomicrobium sp.]
MPIRRRKDVAGHLAEAKALQISTRHPQALVLGADQTLLFDGAVVGKCPDLVAARRLLERLRGRTHSLVGGYVLASAGAVVWRHGETATLSVRDFSDGFLDFYLAAEGEGLLSAVGCYKLEGLGAQLFARIEGDYFSILGLALHPLLAELRRQGVLRT